MTEIGYRQAMAELEAILAEIEAEEVDVDLLATKVRRAAELIRLCRQRIDDTQVQVDQIVAGLEASADDPVGVTTREGIPVFDVPFGSPPITSADARDDG